MSGELTPEQSKAAVAAEINKTVAQARLDAAKAGLLSVAAIALFFLSAALVPPLAVAAWRLAMP